MKGTMGSDAVADTLDLDYDGMMQETVEHSCRDDGSTEDLTSFGKAAIAGQNHRALFVAGIDQLEGEVGAAGGDRQVAHFVDD